MKKNLAYLLEKYNLTTTEKLGICLSTIFENNEVSEDEFNDNLFEDELFEDDIEEKPEDKKMSEEELKIESLKVATNIGKLMSGVTPEDIIKIADVVSNFIRNHRIGEEYQSSNNKEISNTSEETKEQETTEETKEQETTEEK